MPTEEVVFGANDRCNQENLLQQLKSGVRSLSAPVDNLLSNWAYMVMASLAWSLKAWAALAAAGRGPLEGETPGGETQAVADGLRHVPPCAGERAGADRPHGTEDPLPALGMESAGSTFSSVCWTSFVSRCDADAATLKPESGCSGPPRPSTHERNRTMKQPQPETLTAARRRPRSRSASDRRPCQPIKD